ncbi:MAG: mechanosensitive ion channel family protein [Actinomycetota bacterium]
MRAWMLTHGVRIAIVVLGGICFSFLARRFVKRMRIKVRATIDGTAQQRIRRQATLTSVLSASIQTIVWAVAVLIVLGELGINLGPLLAGAGIAGVAIGFGAQSIVRDVLAGFLILLEDHYAVGSRVRIDVGSGIQAVEGVVEALTLRATTLRRDRGELVYIPNGSILVASNRSARSDEYAEVQLSQTR